MGVFAGQGLLTDRVESAVHAKMVAQLNGPERGVGTSGRGLIDWIGVD